MNKKSVFAILIIIALIFVIWYLASSKSAIDKIQDYTITVTPQDDGTLNILYDITWEVLDSTSEGPLTWVQIGIPNSSVDSISALTNNIKTIEQYNSTYVRIDFRESYQAGDVINFRFKLHQKNMYSLDNGICKYEFTPGWFDKIAVNKITIKWKAGNILKANTENRENGYYIWTDTLKKGEKLTAKVEYDETTYKGLNDQGQFYYALDTNSQSSSSDTIKTFIILFVIAIILITIGSIGSDGYDSHRGYGGCHHYDHDTYSSCVSHSSCACAHSCACACACAGGGRAGCSKKDFYGTKLKSKDIIKKL